MTMGEIAAVQDGSPAAAAGIKPADQITRIDGGPVGDPMTIARPVESPCRQDRQVDDPAEGREGPDRRSVRLRQPVEEAPPFGFTRALAVSSLGIAYRFSTGRSRRCREAPLPRRGCSRVTPLSRRKSSSR